MGLHDARCEGEEGQGQARDSDGSAGEGGGGGGWRRSRFLFRSRTWCVHVPIYGTNWSGVRACVRVDCSNMKYVQPDHGTMELPWHSRVELYLRLRNRKC